MNELDILRNHFLGYHSNFFDSFKTVSTYPPYNIRGNEEKGVIEMALAGFTKDDLNVEVKDNLLTIIGKKEKKRKSPFVLFCCTRRGRRMVDTEGWRDQQPEGRVARTTTEMARTTTPM